ncbi:transcription factor WhiB [Streptomyces halstedii]|uniref:Transcription factor WhiB n=2 Tax=Streptomyces halstedii TaxID=1944 RepID=A0A6N9UAC5_STRHA|nr:transcription factor WhiB [Streptomyces halstedii]
MYRMSSTQARHTRRAVLQTAIDVGARCQGMDPDVWFRADDESDADWQPRRDSAMRVCNRCPVRAACEELALRNGDGELEADELVRAGLTGPELAAVRTSQALRLAAAVDADRDTEGRQLDQLTVELVTEAGKNPDSSRNGGPRATALRAAAQTHRLRTLAARIRQIRTARRTRNGWGVAA